MIALPCGTAIELDPGFLAALRGGAAAARKRSPAWAGYLAHHGLADMVSA